MAIHGSQPAESGRHMMMMMIARLIAWPETHHLVLNCKGMSAAYLWD